MNKRRHLNVLVIVKMKLLGQIMDVQMSVADATKIARGKREWSADEAAG